MSFSVLRALAVAALTVSTILSAVGCSVDIGATNDTSGNGLQGTPSCASAGGPVVVYSAVPTVGSTWWPVGQEPADVAAGDPSGDASSSGGGGALDGSATPAPNDPGDTSAPADSGTDSGSSSSSADNASSSDGSDASDDTDDDDDDDDDANTDALHPSNLGGACYSCDLTCTTVAPQPGQPAALSISHGARSEGAACAAAERTLRHYAADAYGMTLNACGPTTG